jgi:hypothetical protein
MKKAVQLVAVCTFGCHYFTCEHVLQEDTLPTAERKGRHWLDGEIAYVRDTQHEPLSDVAIALSRTYYATAHVRSKIKRGILNV